MSLLSKTHSILYTLPPKNLPLRQALAFSTEDFTEGGVILFIIVMNAAIGFYQEFNAERTMEALRNMSSPTAQVIRDEV